MEKFLAHMDTVYKAALLKTRDEHLAEDLTQETFLHTLNAISKGVEIENPRAYLLSVLHNRFFMVLREKYKFSTVYYGDMPLDIPLEADFSKLERSEDAETIRKALAFLSYTYREVMVRYYMKNESVNEIANALSIPKGTVLSRLDVGRKKVKEGMTKMEKYNESSYRPQKLSLSITGKTSQKDEPFSCVKGLLEQNILTVAYEKPLTTEEIAHTMGIPTAYVEDSVDKLIDAQLLKRDGKKVATDFVIISLDDRYKAAETSKAFAKDTFDKVHATVTKAVKQYEEIPGFMEFNDVQKYACAVFSMDAGASSDLYDATVGASGWSRFSEIPDRPNFGKWLVGGFLQGHDSIKVNKNMDLGVSGRLAYDDIRNENLEMAYEWDTTIGRTHQADFKFAFSFLERALLIDAVKNNTVNGLQAELLPDMMRLGFIKEENGVKMPAIPYLSQADKQTFHEIENELGKAFCTACLDDFVKVCKTNKIAYPKCISAVMPIILTLPLTYISMAYVYEAAERGFISIEEGKNYPVMLMFYR